MELQVIGTGSEGNAYVLRAEGQALLWDAGLPARNIIRAAGDWRELQGCLLTHEHQDHAKSAIAIAQMGVPTYASAGTIDAIRQREGDHVTRLIPVEALTPFQVGTFTVMAFGVQHDAAAPYGYLVRYDPTGEVALYATDTYYLRYTFPGVNYWIIECNYCDEIVDAQRDDGTLSDELRSRLRRSHLSLRRLLEIFRANDMARARAIVLVHLSNERSNEAEIVQAVRDVTGVEYVYAAANHQTIPFLQVPF